MQDRSRSSNSHSILLLKSFYFLYYAALASLSPFLTLFYEGIGLSGRQIGVLAAMPPLVTLFASPIWSGVADATNRHHRLLGLAIGGVIVMTAAISLSTSFLMLIPIIMIFAFFTAPIMPLVDSSALVALGSRKNQYGRLRLWGGVGWGVAAPIVGGLVEKFGHQWSFYGYIFIMFFGLLISIKLPIRHVSIGRAFWRGFHLLMGNRQWLTFLLIIFASSVGSSVVHNFLFLYMKSLGASTTLMGAALTVATISELAVFYYADYLLERWGVLNFLLISLVGITIRLFGYYSISVPLLVLPIQLLHGLTFAARWSAGIAYTDRAAPKGMGATAQGIFNGVWIGMSGIFGGLIGGWMYEMMGPVEMFRFAGWATLLMLVFYIVLGRRLMEIRSV